MIWTAVDEVDRELCIRSYKGTFKTEITHGTVCCCSSRGNAHFSETHICLFLSYFICKHDKNSGEHVAVLSRCPPVHTPLPHALQGLNVLRSQCSRNIYWHLLVQGLTFQALFAVLKCQSAFSPQSPVMLFLKCFDALNLSRLKLCQT